ncbi:MAG: nucleotidyltransferase family protein [Lachnospirales bacterium]
MNDNEKYIINLSKASLFDTQPNNPPKNIDWHYIYNKASEQSITALLAHSILKLPKKNQPENYDKWRKSIIKTGYIMAVKSDELDRMMNIYAQNNIYPIYLKGIVVKDLYPVPELRTMGDFDIWIDKKERKIAEDLFISQGYKVVKDTLFTTVDKNSVHGEVFISLEDDFRTEPEYWNERLKENTFTDEKGRKILTPTYELAYSIIHAAKHLTREGCGIRNLFDVVLILHHRGSFIDFDLAEKICMAQGYEKVFYYMLDAAKNLYGVKNLPVSKITDNKKKEKFIEYLLCYGVFGRSTEGNVISEQVVRREGEDVSMFRRIFFPPRKMIQYKYQYVKKTPLLLPVAWIHRFISSVFIKGNSLIGMIRGIDESMRYGKDRDKRLKDLDLMK